MELNTTLLRERFILTDIKDAKAAPVIATSNRITLALQQGTSNTTSETFVVRAQNMHSAIRMAACILQTFLRVGPLLVRAEPFDFDDAWRRICSDHEVSFNHNRWVAVYARGKPIFKSGDYHAFLDVIEKCDSVNPGNYDRAVHIAEDTFRKMGRELTIAHEANIGMVIHVKPDMGRCGLILRNPHKSTTFNYMAESKSGDEVSPLMCLTACAAFLEGVQLAVRVGMINEKIRANILERHAPEAKESQSATRRLKQLEATIIEMEERLSVRYRPEKPEFHAIIQEGELFQRKLLEQHARA